MAAHLQDEQIDQLAERAQRILNAPSKTDAVRQALERVVDEDARSKPPLEERLKALQTGLKALGKPDPNFDDKTFLDEMWEV
jgi:antitoxin VapB